MRSPLGNRSGACVRERAHACVFGVSVYMSVGVTVGVACVCARAREC